MGELVGTDDEDACGRLGVSSMAKPGGAKYGAHEECEGEQIKCTEPDKDPGEGHVAIKERDRQGRNKGQEARGNGAAQVALVEQVLVDSIESIMFRENGPEDGREKDENKVWMGIDVGGVVRQPWAGKAENGRKSEGHQRQKKDRQSESSLSAF